LSFGFASPAFAVSAFKTTGTTPLELADDIALEIVVRVVEATKLQ
jgi:hypothetical protein